MSCITVVIMTNRSAYSYVLPDICLYPQMASFTADYTVNLVCGAPKSGPDREEAKQIQHMCLNDPNHLITLAGIKDGSSWTLGAQLYLYEQDWKLQKAVPHFDSRQVTSLLGLFYDEADAICDHYDVEDNLRPVLQPELARQLDLDHRCGQRPYVFATSALMPDLEPGHCVRAHAKMVEDVFAPIEKTYNLDVIADRMGAGLHYEAAANLLSIKHAAQFVAIHAPTTIKGKPQPDHHLIFAVKPLATELVTGSQTFEDACMVLDILEKAYIQPVLGNIPPAGLMHYSRWQHAPGTAGPQMN